MKRNSKMRNFLFAWVVCLASLIVPEADSKGYCSFPRFLWRSPTDDSSIRKWIGQTEYFGNTDSWTNQLIITAHETEIVTQRRVHVTCTRQRNVVPSDKIPCYRQDTVFSIICLSEEPNGKYRVQQVELKNSSFTCLRFESRNSNLVQVFKSALNAVNEDRLCYDESLKREDWPWRAAERQEWNFCSLRGGFDFSSFLATSTQQYCAGVWRPSRLESECVRGEGLSFLFPHQNCSIFYRQSTEHQFRCWSSWTEKQFRFILFGEAKQEARYVLRLPREIRPNDRFSGHLYLSPVATTTELGQPPNSSSISYYRLQMRQSESGVCYDESEHCPQYAQQGRCTNAAMFEYANYCKKSCRLCDFAPSIRPECSFPSEFVGDWVLMNSQDRELLTVQRGNIKFSTLGNFVCKNRHWEKDFYKLFSIFNDGCRPRHTCMHLSQDEDNSLTFKMSVADRADRSFQLCETFTSDHDTFESHLRNWKPKYLLASSILSEGTCGIGRFMRADITFSGGAQCSGYLTDINSTTCTPGNRMSVRLTSCRLKQHLDFRCVASAKLSNGVQFLVTKAVVEDGDDKPAASAFDQHICWLILFEHEKKSALHNSPLALYRIQCDTRERILATKSNRDIIYINAFKTSNATSSCPSENDVTVKQHQQPISGFPHLPGQEPQQHQQFAYAQQIRHDNKAESWSRVAPPGEYPEDDKSKTLIRWNDEIDDQSNIVGRPIEPVRTFDPKTNFKLSSYRETNSRSVTGLASFDVQLSSSAGVSTIGRTSFGWKYCTAASAILLTLSLSRVRLSRISWDV